MVRHNVLVLLDSGGSYFFLDKGAAKWIKVKYSATYSNDIQFRPSYCQGSIMVTHS